MTVYTLRDAALDVAAEVLADWGISDSEQVRGQPLRIFLNGLCGKIQHKLDLLPWPDDPLDDGAAIDDVWLLAVGFDAFGGIPTSGLRLVISDGWSLMKNSDGQWMMRGDYLPRQPVTRGDLRRLCKSFGIDLRESAT